MFKGAGCAIACFAIWLLPFMAAAQSSGGIRGSVQDADFAVPLGAVRVSIAETSDATETAAQGNYAFTQLPPGIYTLVFAKDGYARQVRSDVLVSPGGMTGVNVALTGEFTEMEEFVVQDLQIGGGSEAGLIELKFDVDALIDSVGEEQFAVAGVGDVASALKLVSGATVQDGKYATIRGLPDRYVNSQINSVRLPTADADKRAVQLDQFPTAAVESIQVSKTFTPDQQGDASGGAVNILLKSIPEAFMLKLSSQIGYRPGMGDDFLSYGGGGLEYWAEDGTRQIQVERLGQNWEGAVGVSPGDEPLNYKWSIAAGGKSDVFDWLRVGGFGTVFYEHSTSYYDDGIDDKLWVLQPGEPMTPVYSRGDPSIEEFLTSLYDVRQGSDEVKWGFLGTLGFETDNHSMSLTSLKTRAAEDQATVAENTRGKEYYFPGYEPDDPNHPGNQQLDASPYMRLETIKYTERQTDTVQLTGRHKLWIPEFELGKYFKPLQPEIEWILAKSSASLNEPDKRQFGALWVPPTSYGIYEFPAFYSPYKPAEAFTLGNVQRTWKAIEEESDQYQFDFTLPFEQWSGEEGYVKVGVFNDDVTRTYNQESFSNFSDRTGGPPLDWDEYWSEVFPDEDHFISEAFVDVDYEGEQKIAAWYYMGELPLASWFSVLGGMRFESTELRIINFPEKEVTWVPPGAVQVVKLTPGDSDVFIEQEDALPAYSFKFQPIESLMLRGSYTETIARQTFKELTPIKQVEYLGGDVFVGNPALQMSALKNYDLRVDYSPYAGGLVSASWFHKDVENPIEYVQRSAGFSYTTAVNYPQGELEGYEFEIRQDLGHFADWFEGLSVGGNAAFIDSMVTIPEYELRFITENAVTERPMTNTPEHLYNLFFTYEMDKIGLKGTELAMFYTVRGDTLVAGALQADARARPDVYETEYGTLNMSLTKKFGDRYNVKFQAKNLTDPQIQRVYRAEAGDFVKNRHTKGREYSLSVGMSF